MDNIRKVCKFITIINAFIQTVKQFDPQVIHNDVYSSDPNRDQSSPRFLPGCMSNILQANQKQPSNVNTKRTITYICIIIEPECAATNNYIGLHILLKT